MKLSDQIGNHADEEIGHSTAVVARSRLYNWQEAAQRIEQDQRAAWRSFYVACAVAGLALAGFLWLWWPVHDACDGLQEPPARSEMTDDTSIRSFDPFTVRRTVET